MKKALAAAGLLVFLFCNTAMAAYTAKTTSDVNLRAGKGTETQAVAVIRSGKQVSVIEEGDIWVKVATSEGKQGWINKKFLTKTKGEPEKKTLETNTQEADKKDTKETQEETVTPPPEKAPLIEDAKAAPEEAANPEHEIQSLRAQLDDVTMQFEALKKDTADCVTLKPEYEKALAEIKNLNQTIDEMDKKIVAKGVRWFLAGAFVLLVGWFMGLNTRQKTRYY